MTVKTLFYEVACDIQEFGEFMPVAVWQKEIGGKFFCINYDFVACDEVDPDEIEEGEILIPMSLGELLTVL